MVIPEITGAANISQFVATEYRKALEIPGLLDSPDDPLHLLNRMADALATLADAPADQLEWAFRGVLDLYSTRLDAWITSLATARLAEHRESAPTGVHLGGWGVVEDLRPDSGPAAESLGFVHAPSLGQAASTAVLRSARMSHRDEEGRMFDLDLTSRRVREASRVLEGMGNGQRLAALLGYRFERALQDRDLLLAQWILPLRMQCPLRSERPDDTALVEPVEVVAARDVVDGLALLQRWAAERDGLLAAAGVAAGARGAVGQVLDEIAGLSDAVSDVLLAEAVHQATSGNLERSGAALAAHDRQGPAPDPEFIRTPRSGPVVAHRVGVWLPADAVGPAPGWPVDLRSVAEPRLDRWLGTVLGNPAQWTVGAQLVRQAVPGPNDAPINGVPIEAPPVDAAPTIVELPTVAVSALQLSALSLVLAARRPGPGRPSELESRLAAHYSALPEVLATTPNATDRLDLNADGLALLIDLAGWAGEVLSAAPLAAEHLESAVDLQTAQSGVGPAETDVAEAVGRADRLVSLLAGSADAVEAALATFRQTPDAPRQRALLDAVIGLAEVEGPDVFPAAGDPIDEHAAAVLGRVRARIQVAVALPTPAPPVVAAGDLPSPGAVEDGALTRARGMVRVLLGNGQPFLPVLKPTVPELIATSLARRPALIGDDPTVVVTWLHRSALVRPLLDPFAALLVHTELDGADVGAELAVVQVPHADDRTWVALPFGPSGAPPAGSVGLVLHAPEGLDPAAGGAGVVIDAWTESVPAATETTAVAFHYDAPGARAPQSMLLAVHPGRAPDHWDFDTLLGCVHEAMDLARLRTVGSRELAPLSTFLPAIFLPDVYTRDVPGVRFAELTANARALLVGGLVADHVLGKSVAGHA